MGSGSLAAMSIFEASFKEDMTKEEAMALVARAIRSGQSPHLVPELLWCLFCAEHSSSALQSVSICSHAAPAVPIRLLLWYRIRRLVICLHWVFIHKRAGWLCNGVCLLSRRRCAESVRCVSPSCSISDLRAYVIERANIIDL